MPLYRIADLTVSMAPMYEPTLGWAEKYLISTDEKPDMTIRAEKHQIDWFVEHGTGITDGMAEHMVLATEFGRELLRFDGTYLHASAILFDGRAYLFSGDSGVGKSTHTAFWQQYYGADKVLIINDDKPAFRFIDGRCIVYGTPFAGGTDKQQNISAPLGAVVFVRQADTDRLTRIGASEIMPLILTQTLQRRSTGVADRLFTIYDRLIKNYPFYTLDCTNSLQAVITACNIIEQREE